MASLDDFKTEARVSLDDFAIEGPLMPLGNEASNLNLAAFTAALSDNPSSIEATYLGIADRLNGSGDREMSEQLLASAKNQVREKGQQALVGIMTDPDLSDEQKQAAATAHMDERSSLYDIQNIASTEALVSESDPDETVESETARINFADSVEEANAFRMEKQSLLNAELAKGNQGLMANVVDFLEIVAPFAEGSVSGRTLSKMRGGDASAIAEGLAWMGGSKAEIRDAMKGLPIAQRRQVMQSVVQAVNESSSIVLPGDNEFARAEMLRVALAENVYGAGEEWLDNSIAVLDMLGVFGLARRGATAAARRLGIAPRARGLETPVPTQEDVVRDRPFVETASDAELRAAEEASESRIADRRLAFDEDASERRIQARQEEIDADPVRRAEDAATRRAEARRAVRGEGRESLSEMEAASEARMAARRTGGDAARMTDEELRMSEDAYEARLRSKARTEAVKAPVQPASYSQNLRNTNPAKARAVNQAVTEDATGQVAQATYGSSRSDALSHDHLPEVKQPGGEVKNKVSMPDVVKEGPVRIPQSVKDVTDSTGAIQYSDAQKVAVASKVVHDFNNAIGITARTEMTVPLGRDIGGNFKVGVTYGPRDNGWTDARDGVERVKNSLRAYGVRDDDVVVLGRQGDEYAPTDIDNPVGTDFLVRVDYDYPISADDVNRIADWTDSTVLHAFFDRMPHQFLAGRHGTLAGHVFDPASRFDQYLLGGANTAANRAAALEKVLGDQINRFTEKFNKLSKPMKNIFDQETRRANLQGWNKKRTTLKAEGWDDEAISALQNWRDAWDTIYWMENTVLAKSLRNNGYGLFVDSSTDSRLFVKEFKRGAIPNHVRAYDPKTGKMENLEKVDIDSLYEKGGSIGNLKSKWVIDQDELVEQIIVRNEPESYVRRIRDDDQVLNYREGYYTVYYDAPRFVDEVRVNRFNKEVHRKPVATSRDLTTAIKTAERLTNNAPEGVKYVPRDARERTLFASDDTWSLQEASGRVAQRVRGERLADANSAITDEMSNHVLGPADALIKAVRSVAPKVAMGDTLDAMKLRSIDKHGHMFPKDRFGNPTFPNDSGPNSIRADLASGEEAAQARALVEYINSLERPYLNLVDDGLKLFFRAMADASAKKELTYLERANEFAAEAVQPTKLGKGTAFTLYLALNPLRQFVVQGFQSVQLLALSPGYVMGQLGPDMAGILSRKLNAKQSNIPKWTGGRSEEELDEMFEAFETSGVLAVIDKSALVKGTLQEVADSTALGGRRSLAGQATGRAAQGVSYARRAGFDAGETMNKMSSWLTHYDLKKREVGKRKLTKSEIDEVTFKSENWTYMMNRAGEVDYNENTFGLAAQFIQVPHKAFLTMTTNRHLTWKQKSRLAAFNLAFFGAAPGTFLYSAVGDILPTDQEGVTAEAREAFMQGLGGYLFNRTVGSMYEFFAEDKTWRDIDFSSLRSIDGEGLWEFGTDLLTTDVGEHIANTPAGSLVLGYNPRIANAIKKVAEFAHFRQPDDDSRATLGETLIEVGKLSSGFSNAWKARLIMEYEKKHNSVGGTTVDEAPAPLAVAQAFGLNSVEEARRWYADNELYERSKQFEDDVKERYRLMAQDLFREGMTQEEDDYAMRVLNYINFNFAESPRAQEIMLQELRKDVQDGNDVFMVRAMRSMEWMEEDSARGLINGMPLDEERKAQLHQLVDDIKAIRDQE